MKFGLFLALVMAGCGTTPNPASCVDNHCSDPERPFCDKDGAIGGEPNTCIAVACTPGEFEACRGDNALMCGADGKNLEQVDCMYGCSDTAGGCNACNTSDCEKHIIPKYLPNICNQLAATDPYIVNSSTILDVSGELNCDLVVTQATGPEICVRHNPTFTIETNQTLTVVGPRVVAFVADGPIRIDGTLDVSSTYGQAGPGGTFATSGGDGIDPQGSGGAGGRIAGGNGGSALDGGAANGGAASVAPVTSTELLAGARGGGNKLFPSGMGGGAVTLISCRGGVAVPGLIDAGGAGGLGGHLAIVNNELVFRAPGGGGAGGTVVLQGMTISVTGQIYANGGGGGAGGHGDLQPNTMNGLDGSRAATAARGGIAASGSGDGGSGGSALSVPGVGKAPPTSGQQAGAGGGSAGALLTYTPMGVAPSLNPVAVSPPFEQAGTVPTN